METERWRQIETLFEAVQAQPPEKRATFLAQACPADAELRAEVRSLLDQQADSFLESAPLSVVHALTAGAKLGNFEIVELLGRGGMGEVWRARDARLRRDVAIKVLPAALARDPNRIARFEREARAASALNHPNIVTTFPSLHSCLRRLMSAVRQPATSACAPPPSDNPPVLRRRARLDDRG